MGSLITLLLLAMWLRCSGSSVIVSAHADRTADSELDAESETWGHARLRPPAAVSYLPWLPQAFRRLADRDDDSVTGKAFRRVRPVEFAVSCLMMVFGFALVTWAVVVDAAF